MSKSSLLLILAFILCSVVSCQLSNNYRTTLSTSNTLDFAAGYNHLYAVTGSGIVVNQNYNTFITTIGSLQCTSIAVNQSSQTDTAYAACMLSNNDLTIVGFNSTGTIDTGFTLTVSLCRSPGYIEFSSYDNLFYISCSNGLVSFDGKSASDIISVSCVANGKLAVNNINGEVYGLCVGANSTSLFSYYQSNVNYISIPTCTGYPSGISIDSVNNVLYTSCLGTTDGGQLLSINMSSPTMFSDSNTIASSTECYAPTDVFFESFSGVVYASCTLYSSVLRVDDSTKSVIDSGSLYNRVIFNSAGILFGGGDNGLVMISGSTLSTLDVRYSPGCRDPWNGYVDPNSGTLYINCINSGDPLLAVYGSNVYLAVPTSICAAPRDTVVDPATGIIYCWCAQGQYSNWIISINKSIVIPIFQTTLVGSTPSIFYNDTLFVTCPEGLIAFPHGNPSLSYAVYKDPRYPNNPNNPINAVALDKLRNIFYIANPNTNQVLAIQNGRITTLPTMCSGTFDLAASDVVVNQETGMIYVSCRYDQSPGGVFSYDGTTVRQIATYSQCPGPTGLAYDDTRNLYAACNAGYPDPSTVQITPTGNVIPITTNAQCPWNTYVQVNPVSHEVYLFCNGDNPVVYSQRFQCISGTTWSQGACTAGTFRQFPMYNSLDCRNCSPGSISVSGAASCSVCPSNPTACVSSINGTYTSSSGVTLFKPAVFQSIFPVIIIIRCVVLLMNFF